MPSAGPQVGSKTSESAEARQGAKQDEATPVLSVSKQSGCREETRQWGWGDALWAGGAGESSQMTGGLPQGDRLPPGDDLLEEGVWAWPPGVGMGRAVAGVAGALQVGAGS